MLYKSLKRLKLPEIFISISLNILSNRSSKIITNNKTTSSFSLNDGIDQGDSISPLWWIIFYDPLISKLENLYKQKSIPNALAYMNDLNILATNKNSLQHLLNITTSFFSLNDIKANSTKTKLIAINTKDSKSINMNSTIIFAQPKTSPIRILGIWISESSIINPNRNKIKEDIQIITNSFKRKLISRQISSYIYNKVLFPRIEFKLQVTFLTENLSNQYQRLVNSSIKHSFKLEKTIPNSWLYTPQIFNIKQISDLQEEVLTSNLYYRITDPIIKPYFQHEILTIQKNFLLPKCPLTFPSEYHFNLQTLFTSSLLFKHNIKICPPSCYHTILNGSNPISKYIPKKHIKKCACTLSKSNIYYIEQLLIPKTSIITPWTNLINKLGFTPRGRIPSWYKTLETINFSDKGLENSKKPLKSKWLIINYQNQILIGKRQKNI